MKCGIYVRLSQEDKNKMFDDDSESIQNQKNMLVQYALENNWEIYNIYSDDDYTGADRNRPQFNQLLLDAKNKLFDIVLCKTQSRFSRELEIVERYINYLFPLWGIRFISIVDNADTQDKRNKKARQINGLINEWYLEDISENVKSVLTNKKKNGKHIGAFALYGYKKDPNEKGHLIIDNEASEVVKEIFNLYIQGYGKVAIAKKLNDRGIPNPAKYKRLNGLNYKSKNNINSGFWKYQTIARTLTDEMYIGNMVQNKIESVSYKSEKKRHKPKDEWIIVKNTHDPIIDMATWDKVQVLIKQKTKSYKKGEVGLFAKKTYCKHCGYPLKATKQSNKRYFRCHSKYLSRGTCISAYVSEERLKETVLIELKTLIHELLDEQMISKKVKLNDETNTKTNRLKKSINNYEKKLNDIDKSIKNLYIDKIKKIITDDEYVMLSEEFRKDKSRYEKTIDEYNEQLLILENQIRNTNDMLKVIKQYTSINELTREIIDVFIDRIYVSRKNEETGELPIEIHWNF